MLWTFSKSLQNYDLKMTRIHNTSNLEGHATTTHPVIFDSANWNLRGTSLRFCSILNDPFLYRSDVAALFQPAIDAIVKGVLHQQEVATQKISVRTLSCLSYSCRDFIEIIYIQSMSYLLVALLPIPGFSTVFLEYSPKEILQWTSFARKSICKPEVHCPNFL